MKKRILMTGILACMLVLGTVVHAQTKAPDASNETEVYKDFNAGHRWATWALNAFVLPGLGSYVIMKDGLGGTIQLVAGLASTGFLIGGAVGMVDYMTTPYNEKNASKEEEAAHIEKIRSSEIALVIGGALFIGNGIFNIVRSSKYHKPQPKTASLADPDAWNIALLPGRDGNFEKVQVAYTLKF